ncbi:XRE family transcriptional regulator [Acinetobacter rudis]|uniref:XRE family transcriptional regulator n=1 Tax=Acinetobacter rudis TaxID=632955 RepID=UPI00280F050E|nr:XRE family transcriptional regulator [Acinetobacter rudis]MDQ8953403.1 XRE family transcriptional regulator [Acinetobacter rudis]
MSRVSIELSASARNNESLILHALDSSSQKIIAESLGVDASTVSRMKTDKRDNNNLTQVEFISAFIDALRLKIVPENDVYCSPEIAEATRVMLAHAFTSPEYMRILFK